MGTNWSVPAKRLFLFANYSWNNQRNDADGPFSLPADSYNLAAEWARAAGVPRHIASAVLNTNVTKSVRVGLSTTAGEDARGVYHDTVMTGFLVP